MRDYVLCVILLTTPVLSQKLQQQVITNTNDNIQQGMSSKPVTENIADRPDDRTLAPIDPTYAINVPLNLGNNSNINNSGYSVTEVLERHDQDTTEKIKLKKNSFSYVQIQGEFDNPVQIPNFLPNYSQGPSESQQNNIGFKRFLDGIKSYIFSMKKGLVDGLHNWYNKNDITNQVRKEIEKFYRSFPDDSTPDFEGSGQIEDWLNREDVQKEILDIYRSLNEESSEGEAEAGEDQNSDDDYEDYSDDYGHHPHFHHHQHQHHHKGHGSK